MIFFFILAFVSFVSLIVEEFIPPLAWLGGAHLYIVPVIMFYGAMALPYPGMLGLAFISGLMVDLAENTHVVDSQVEISLGWSILVYAALGAIMSGFRPLFHRGRWEIHCLLSGLFTSLILLAQYLMITVRRGGFVYTPDIGWRIAGSGVAAALIAPFYFFVLNWVASLVGYDVNPEKKGIV
ncbi:MAG TPA: hypothetical protein VG733_00185 [Chthoniobacteraceae bacterium]|nr:hypothetical protein [Chthoniobacteraceae bacterium]